ncbi:hypothetical protein KY285_029055 [Solanum tuberosum]|nr:hypothetical protein KY285_029055 [Solanum tuberosum]
MDLMNRVFKQYLDLFIIFFTSDILIYSRSMEEHVTHLRVVLQTLTDRQLFTKSANMNSSYSPSLSSVIWYPAKGFEWIHIKLKQYSTAQTQLSSRYQKFLGFGRVGLGCVFMQRDYDINVLYHSSKANVVVDALSKLSMGSVAHVEEEKKELAKDVHRLARLGVHFMDTSNGGVIVQNGSKYSLVVEKVEVFSQGGDGVLRYQGRLCVPNVGELRQQFLTEAHNFRDIANFVAKCPNCQQVKEVINMDFITGLPHTCRQHDSIWVIVDRVTKFAQFLAVKTTDSAEDYAKLYIYEIVSLRGVNLSITFHPQTDGKAERTIQTLGDILRACMMNFKGSWDDHLPLIESSYNNSFHSSIQMAPYEALYGRRSRTPIGWFEVGEEVLTGPDSVHEEATEEV